MTHNRVSAIIRNAVENRLSKNVLLCGPFLRPLTCGPQTKEVLSKTKHGMETLDR